MKKNNSSDNFKSILFVFLCSIPLLLLLVQPISGDLSIYLQGARTILDGKNIYTDYLDLKPPTFYFLYVPIEYFANGSEIIVKLFDYLIQFFFTILFFKIIINTYNDKKLAGISIFIYSMSYAVLGYTNSFHGESWFNLLILIIIRFQMIQFSKKNSIIIGIVSGIIISIKFSFAIIILPLLICDIISREIKLNEIIKKYTIILFISIVIVVSSMLILLKAEIFNDYVQIINYLKYYSSQPPISAQTIKLSIKAISYLFADNYSLFLTILIPISFIALINRRSELSPIQKKFTVLNFIFLIFLLISIVIERKFSNFHFLRIYPFLTFFASYGFMELIKSYKKLKDMDRYLKWIIVTTTFTFILLFSPITRILYYLPSVYYRIFNIEKFDNFYTRPDDNIILRKVYKNINSYLSNYENKNIIVVSIGGNIINYNIRHNKISKFSQSTFYFSNANIQKWKNEIVDEFDSADILIIQTNDNHQILNGHNFTSYEMVQKNQELKTILDNKFTLDTVIVPFNIYKTK